MKAFIVNLLWHQDYKVSSNVVMFGETEDDVLVGARVMHPDQLVNCAEHAPWLDPK